MSHRRCIWLPALLLLPWIGGPALGQGLPGVAPGLDIGFPQAGAPSQIILLMNEALEIGDVTAGELLGSGSPVRDAGTARVQLGVGLSGLAGDPVAGWQAQDRVQRIHDHVFRAWVRNGRPDLADLQVQYAFVGASGAAGRLEPMGSPESHIRAAGLPIGPYVLLRVGAWQLIQAGGRFDLDLSSATVSGDYRGSLLVVINSL